MKTSTQQSLLESWLNVPAVLESHYFAPHGEIQYGVRESNLSAFNRIIQTRRRGIPIQWIIEESRKHYLGPLGFLDNKAQKNRKYNNLPRDSIIPNFWFVNVAGGGTLPIKLLTAHINRREDKIYGIASDDNRLPGIFGPTLLLYTIKRGDKPEGK